jgi:hypothetical protein
MKWDYPVYDPEAGKVVEGTSSRAARKALTREEAVRFIAGDDPRPLLVLRECKVCNGTDEALLKGGIDNEKTFLMSAWFHCVKLPVDVMEENHPFHNLFVEDKPEHLFVCSVDGSNHKPLQSQTSRTELWSSMRDLIAVEYADKPDKPLKAITALLDKLDDADRRVRELSERRDEILEEDGPDSRKLPKLTKKLEKEEKELARLKADVQKSYQLELRRQKTEARRKAEAEAAGAEAAPAGA